MVGRTEEEIGRASKVIQDTWDVGASKIEGALEYYRDRAAARDRIFSLDPSYEIPRSMMTETPLNYAEKYIFKAKVTAQIQGTDEIVVRWFTVENNENMPKEDWEELMRYSIGHTIIEHYFDIIEFIDYEMLVKTEESKFE